MNNFLPDTGRLEIYQRPQGPGVRVDDGFNEGMDIPIFYDPMIAKLIVYGATREEAITRMIRAIDEYKVKGIKTTLPFGKWVMQNEHFIKGNIDTGFIGKYFKPESLQSDNNEEALIAALIAATVFEKKTTVAAASNNNMVRSKWKENRLNE
jgi:acetyl-CoA carboxylase, biotin carboxylase subunit